MKTIVGPARCSGCQAFVWWAKDWLLYPDWDASWSDWAHEWWAFRPCWWPPRWVNRDETPHRCKETP